MDDGDVLVDARSEPPVSIRRSGGRVLTTASSAAPVGGDDLAFDLVVGPDARADVGSAAATIVWPSADGAASVTRSRCRVGPGGHLHWEPEPTISVAGSRHQTSLVVELAAGAGCTIVEELVLGRSTEPAGQVDVSMRVERAGRPLLHHVESFGPGVPGAGSVVSVGDARHVLMAAVVGVGVDAGADVAGEPGVAVEAAGAAAWLAVAVDAAVVLAVGPDRRAVHRLVGRVAPALFDQLHLSGIDLPTDRQPVVRQSDQT